MFFRELVDYRQSEADIIPPQGHLGSAKKNSITAVGKAHSISSIEFNFDNLHGLHGMIRPVKNSKAGDLADLNLPARRINNDDVSFGKRGIP